MVVAALAGIGPAESSATATVKTFLLDWQNEQYSAAAAVTTGSRTVVTRTLQAAYQELGADDLALSMGPITSHGDTALAYFDASIDLGRGGLPWQYQGHFTLRRSGSGWRVVWNPAVIAPGLGTGDRLAVLTTLPGRAPLVAAGGQPLMRRSTAFEVGVVPDKLTDARLTAQDLAQVAGLGLDADEMDGQILSAPPESFLELVQLDPASYQRLASALSKVPGVIIRQAATRLFASTAPAITGVVGTETSPVLVQDGEPYRPGTTVGLSGLERTYQGRLAGTPTTEVVVQNAAGQQVRVLKRWAGHAGVAVRTTIDATTQQAAQRALAGLGFSAAIVAVRPGGGQILAVAQHAVAGMPAVSPLTGQYQPGQAFMIVSTEALLESDAGFSANTPIPCDPTNLAGGQTFANRPAEPFLGSKPKFSVDFAHACSTAFAGLSLRLSPSDLDNAAAGFGIGTPWHLPLPAFAGRMRSPASSGQQAADAIGTGTVLVSPLDMALAAGLVRSGSWHAPSLVTSPPDPGLASKTPFRVQVVSQLRKLMRETVTSGAGKAANVPGAAVYGQVGSAPVAGHPGLRAIWFVGFRGDVAFAILIFSRSAAFSSVAQVARQFAAALPARS